MSSTQVNCTLNYKLIYIKYVELLFQNQYNNFHIVFYFLYHCKINLFMFFPVLVINWNSGQIKRTHFFSFIISFVFVVTYSKNIMFNIPYATNFQLKRIPCVVVNLIHFCFLVFVSFLHWPDNNDDFESSSFSYIRIRLTHHSNH